MAWIRTYSGKKFDLALPQVGDICLEDVAHSLSQQCRFGGHCRSFYSVAQHAVEVSGYLERQSAHPVIQFWGLHHDDQETYLCDVPGPLKRMRWMSEFRNVEVDYQRLVAMRWDLPWPEPPSVKFADQTVLAAEIRDLLEDPFKTNHRPMKKRIEPKPVCTARTMYLARHDLLVRKIKEEGNACA